LAWPLASVLFSSRVAGFEDYPGPTGALGAVIALLMWLSATIIIVGVELNSEDERRR